MSILIYPRAPVTLPTAGAVLREPYARGLVAAFAPGAGYGLVDLVSGLSLTRDAGASLGTAGGTAGLICGSSGPSKITAPAALKVTLGGVTVVARMAFYATPAANAQLFAVTANNTGTSPFVAYGLGIEAGGLLRLAYSNGATFVQFTGAALYQRAPAVGKLFTMVGLFSPAQQTIYFGPDEGTFVNNTAAPSYSATSEIQFGGGGGSPNVCIEYGLIYNRRLIPSELKLFRDNPYHWIRPAAARQFALGLALVTVPDVVGLTETAAGAALGAVGLVTGTVTPGSSETVPAGQVISQSPTAGSSVTLGSAVALVISTGPARWKLTIGGVDQTASVDAVSMSFVLNERARMTVVLADLIPDKFTEIVSYAKDGYTPLFGGVILTRNFRGRNQYDPTFQVTLECGDYFTYADWTYTAELKYDADVTLKTVLTDLVDDYLATYGITLDPAQVVGPTLTPFIWRVKRVSDAIRELADRTGYVAVISPTKVLRMFVPGTEAAPFSITEAAPHAQELAWTDTSHTPATSVIVIAGPNGTREVHDERHHGDGANRIFPLYAPFVAVIGALSRSDEAGGYPLGICGVDIDPGTGGDYPYCYDVPTNAIHQRADQPVVPVGEYLWLWYLAEFPFQVSASCDSPLPFEIQRVEARPDVLSIPAAQQIAEGLVDASCADPRELAITTDEDGFAVGQALTVALATTRSIAGAFVITDVSMQMVLDTDQGDAYWVYQLKAIESTKYTGSYLDEWRRITTAPSTFVAPDDAVTRATLRAPRKPRPEFPPSGPKYLAPGPDVQATPRDVAANPLPAEPKP